VVVSELSRSANRLATMTGRRGAPQIYATHHDRSLAGRFSPDVLRAMLFASTMTATAIGAGLLWLAW